MKRLLLIVGVLLLCATAYAQSPPLLNLAADGDTGLCTSSAVACTGSAGQTAAYKNTEPQIGRCATGPLMTSGTYSGYQMMLCEDRQFVTVYTVNPSTGAVAQVGSPTTTANWVITNLGGCNGNCSGTNGQPPGTGVEWTVYYDPYINTGGTFSATGGAFVVGVEAQINTSGLNKVRPILAVSQSEDPTGGWNGVELYKSTIGDVNGDFYIHVGFNATSLCISTIDLPTNTFASDAWCWGKKLDATTTGFPNFWCHATGSCGSVDYSGTDNIPLPTVTDFSIGNEVFGSIDTTTASPAAYYLASFADNATSGTQKSKFTPLYGFYKLTWNANQYQGTFAKTTVSGGFTVNAGDNSTGTTGGCITSSVANTAGPPDIQSPGYYSGNISGLYTNLNNAGNTQHPGEPVIYNNHMYWHTMLGCQMTSNNTIPNQEVLLDFDLSTSPPTLTNLGTIGASTFSGLGVQYMTTTTDNYGNVFWMGNTSSNVWYTSPVVYYKVAGSSTINGPYCLDSDPTGNCNVAASGTITTSGSSCSGSNCVSYTFGSQSPDFVGIVINGSLSSGVTGSIKVADQSGTDITTTCFRASQSPTTNLASPYSLATTGDIACPATGKTGLKVFATTLTSGTPTVTFQPFYYGTPDGPHGSYTDFIGTQGGSWQDVQKPYNVWLGISISRAYQKFSWQVRNFSLAIHVPCTGSSPNCVASGSGVVLSPSGTTTIAPSASQAYTIAATYIDGISNSAASGETVTWSNDNPTGFSMTSPGTFKATLASQTAHITATVNGQTSGSVTLVSSSGTPTLTSIALTASGSTNILYEGVVSYTFQCSYSSGSPDGCPGTTSASLINSDTTIGTLTGSGSSGSTGSATFTALGLSGSVTNKVCIPSDCSGIVSNIVTVNVTKPVFFKAH